jgi:DNA repair protein RadA/Sms
MWPTPSTARRAPSAQVRAAAHELTTFAKRRGVAVMLVGHVTKEGQIAGPRVVEHMVDTVLYFEGERGHQFRILRAVKNRFGPADEIGVFEMTGAGLAEVSNPSALFLSDRDTPAPAPSSSPGSRARARCWSNSRRLWRRRRSASRAARWWAGTARACDDPRRAGGARGHPLPGLDVYLNVAGGMRISEPAADLAVAAALLSAREDAALPRETVVFGEFPFRARSARSRRPKTG